VTAIASRTTEDIVSTPDRSPRRAVAHPHVRRQVGAACTLVLATLAPLQAQVGPLSSRAQPSAIVESSSALAVEAQEERQWLAVSGALGLARTPADQTSHRWRAAGSVSALLAPPPLGAWRLSGALTNWSPAGAAAPPSTVAPITTAGVRLSRTLGRSAGAWVGWSEQRALVAERRGASTPSYGFWKQFGGVLVSVGTSHHSSRSSGWTTFQRPGLVRDSSRFTTDTSTTWRYSTREGMVTDTARATRLSRWADGEARAYWAVRRLALESRVGARLTRSNVVAPTVWGDVEATYWLRPQWALVGAIGTRAARADLALGAERFAGLGLRVSPRTFRRTPPAPEIRPSAAAFTLRRTTGDAVVVSVLVPRARTVELSADFTRWQPLALRMTEAGRWETTVTLPPGTYHVNLRVDGDRWTAPPGVVAVDDGFGGTAGLVVAQ
jgi:hypothetical protein